MTSLSNKVHWGHGIALGAVFGLISLVGFTGFAAITIFFLLFWMEYYAALGIAPLALEANELITDLFHKGVYALATGVTYQIIAWMSMHLITGVRRKYKRRACTEGVTCLCCESNQVVKRGFDETQPLRQRYQYKACL